MPKSSNNSTLPDDVISVGNAFHKDPSNTLHEIASLLIKQTPDLANMWHSLEKLNTYPDDLWISSFLESAESARNLPAYHYKSSKDRSDLSGEIMSLAKNLVIKLKANSLDAHITHNDGKLFNGFFLHEDFTDSNRATIDAGHDKKLKASKFIMYMAERAQKKIKTEPLKGKISKNAKAVRFIRLLADRNIFLHKDPLNTVVATATNAIFNTDYTSSDVTNLLTR